MRNLLKWKSALAAPAVAVLMTGTVMLVGAAPASAAQQKSQLSAQNKQFLMEAAQGDIVEIEMAQVAMKKAQDENTKNLAQHIIKDHTASHKQIMKIASALEVIPPVQIDPQHQKMINQLSKEQTSSLEQTYIVEQVKGHTEMISVFQQEVEQGQNKQLVGFAQQTLPTLKEHLKMAQKLNSTSA